MNNEIMAGAAAHIVNSLPEFLRSVILEDDVFCKSLGLSVRSTVSISGVEFDRDEFFTFLKEISDRKFYARGGDESGAPLIEGVLSEHGNAQISCGENCYEIRCVGLLSSDISTRQKTLLHISQKYLFSDDVIDEIGREISEGGLSSSAFASFELRLQQGFDGVLAHFEESIVSNGATGLNAAIPSSDGPVIAVTGEPVSGISYDEFADSVLCRLAVGHLRVGIERAIELLGPASVLPVAVVSAEIAKADPDDLYDAISSLLGRPTDPFTLALCFDVCCLMAPDDRFVEVGLTVIEAAFNGASKRMYEDFSIALSTVAFGFQRDRILASSPLYHRRMGYWAWAAFISRTLGGFEFDRGVVRSYLTSTELGCFSFTGLLERKESAFWRPEWISPSNIRGLLLRRFAQALEAATGVAVPKAWEDALTDYSVKNEDGEIVFRLLPGPLDEFSDRFRYLRKESVENEQKLLISDDSILDNLSRINFLCLSADLSQELMNYIRAELPTLAKCFANSIDEDKVISAFQALCHLAVINKDIEIADVAMSSLRAFNLSSSGGASVAWLHGVLDASYAYCDDAARSMFIRENMLNIALGNVSAQDALRCLKILHAVVRCNPSLELELGPTLAAFRIVIRGL